MQAELSALQRIWSTAARTWEHWLCVGVMGWLGFVSWALWYRTRRHGLERRRDRQLREELETYARLDAHLAPGDDVRELAKRICRMVADKSAFRRVAILLRDAESRFYVAASTGIDLATANSLTAHAQQMVSHERSGTRIPGARATSNGNDRTHPNAKSLFLDLQPPDLQRTDLQRALVLPLRTGNGLMTGALTVMPQTMQPPWLPSLEEAVPPLEALAAKLARSLETAQLIERLVRVEKLAGLGRLAGGVAHELNNPLTAVLGFAEIIAESSSEARVRDDAQTIVTEALRMRAIVLSLVNFWRPVVPASQLVDLALLVREIANECGATLARRGVTLAVVAGEDIPPVHGDAGRLRIVLESLLTNAAQALEHRMADSLAADAEDSGRLPHGDKDPPTIRLTVSEMGDGPSRAVHLVVSDSGTGFREPSRVFDPFYTTRQPQEGSGMGLSICYGIVREHGGEISAFNLHPHGAAVVVELPAGDALVCELPSAMWEAI